MTLAPVADRALVLTSTLLGLASLHMARPNLHIEWMGNDSPVILRETNGWTTTTALWTITLTDDPADIYIEHT